MSTIPAHRVDTGRLTDLDYARIDDAVNARVADVVATMQSVRSRSRMLNDGVLMVSLYRLAHHSIGCSQWDLRDVELWQIEQLVDAVVASYDR